MDIKKWLQQTVDGNIDLDYEVPQPEAKEVSATRSKRWKHAASESTASSPALEPERQATKKAKQRHAREVSSAQSITSALSSNKSSSASTSSSSSQGSSSSEESEHFERRKRHKTRKDLYEPNSGARKRRSRKKEQNESEAKRKKKKKHHRTEKKKQSKRAGKPGQDLINNFSAKNVQSDRLTVRPFDDTSMARYADNIVATARRHIGLIQEGPCVITSQRSRM